LKGWIEEDGPAGLVHRRAGAPDRWDVRVARDWPIGRVGGAPTLRPDRRAPGTDGAGGAPTLRVRRRLARQIRQDVWRACRRTPGFVPRILVCIRDNHLYITAGGAILTGRVPPGLERRIAEVLDKTDNRRRWQSFARG